MKVRSVAVACAVAAAAFGISACSSGGSGNLPGGVSGTCKFVWTEIDVYNNDTTSPYFSTYSAAENWGNAQWQQDKQQGAYAGELLYGGVVVGPPGPPDEGQSIKVTASQTTAIGSVTVAYYTKGGSEISSNQISIGETLTANQSSTVNQPWTTNGVNPPSNAASCQVVSWTPGQ